MSQPVPPPPRDSGRVSPLGWTLRGLILVGVSVLSGVIWLAISPGASDEKPDDSQAADPGPTTKFDFDSMGAREGFQDCADASTGKIKEFFAQHGCEHLRRVLYTTTLPDGQKVLTSLITVRMGDAATAQQLDDLVTQDATGNVQDLVSAGEDVPEDFPNLIHDLGYASQVQGKLVVIGESAYFSKPETYEDKQLTGVTKDALKLAKAQDNNTGTG